MAMSPFIEACVIRQQTAPNVYLSSLAHGMVQDYCDCFSRHLLNSHPSTGSNNPPTPLYVCNNS